MNGLEMRRRAMMVYQEQKPKNLIDVTQLLTSSVWWKGNRQWWGDANVCTTPKIAVVPGKTYVLKRDPAGQSYVNYFDGSGQYLNQYQWGPNGKAETRTLPNNVYYVGISMSYATANDAYFMLVE